MLTSEIDQFLKDNPLPKDAEGIIRFRGKNIEELSLDEMVGVVNDFSQSTGLRFGCLGRMAQEFPERMIEFVEGFRNAYLFSGSDGLENILKFIALECPNIHVATRYQVVLALFHTAERTIKKEPEDEIEDLCEFNLVRLKKAGDVLGDFCESSFAELPSPSKIEAVFKFLKNSYFFRHFDRFIKIFIELPQLKSDYKYKALLGIEKQAQPLKELGNLLWKRHSKKIGAEDPPAEPPEENSPSEPGDFIEEHVIREEVFRYVIHPEFLDYRRDLDQAVLGMFVHFLAQDDVELNYRILAAQNSLVKPYISERDQETAQGVLLEFISEDKRGELTDQQSADIADVLLQYGDEEVKKEARAMIKHLGFKNSKGRTLFDNAQNVHTHEIEESVIEILEHLTKLPLYKIEGVPVDYEYVYKDIRKKLKEAEFFQEKENRDDVKVSLNRVYIDRALYSKMSCTLESILLRVWSYIQKHEHQEELFKRLIQELVDMAGWCSSGYAFRLLNTLSGFGEFSIKIGWADQITANFSGRFTAKINAISDEDERSDIITGFTCSMEEDPLLRRKFLTFFMKNMPYIREEMWIEFKEYIDDASFDLAFRKAIAQVVEGIALDSGIKTAIKKQKLKEEKMRVINDRATKNDDDTLPGDRWGTRVEGSG